LELLFFILIFNSIGPILQPYEKGAIGLPSVGGIWFLSRVELGETDRFYLLP
jgi:hypothetical protein